MEYYSSIVRTKFCRMQENRWKQMVKDNTHEPDRERERFPCICGTVLNQKKKNILNVENEHGAIKNRGG